MRVNNNSARLKRGAALICFSHLRWNFVYQRPQHLLSRAAKRKSVFFFEEPIFDSEKAFLELSKTPSGVVVVVPHLPPDRSIKQAEDMQRELLNEFLAGAQFSSLTFWYYTPMALAFSEHIDPDYCVYDCMDELSAFRFAPEAMIARERQLLELSDVVFTGGQSLFEAKRHCHPNIHCFQSSIDKEHFAKARHMASGVEPADQANIPRQRVGFFGVIDERMDIDLVDSLAKAAPELQIVMLGPVVKINPADLPRAPNLHWLGAKQYDELPAYLAGWDCGIMPFAINESTRFISPTKTPEFLSAGLPLVSTNITDVRRPYGELGLVAIANNAAQFLAAIQAAIPTRNDSTRLRSVDHFLADKSWDATFDGMFTLIEAGQPREANAGSKPYRQEEAAL
jgi:glycosyltransferase involved in cell wall biosynthesis